MEHLKTIAQMVCAQWQDLAVIGAIMVSAIIVFIGILKPLVFNRIPWQPLRKFVLSFANVFFSFVATALYFAIDKFATIAKMILNNKDTKAIETEIKKATNELKATAKAELKSARKKNNKNDKEWENL